MVGAGDSAALAQADRDIVIGSGVGVVIRAGDIICPHPVGAIWLSRAILGPIKVNLFWAFVYGIAALLPAVVSLLGPLVVGAAMGLSSVFGVNNSLRLRRFRAVSTTTRSRERFRCCGRDDGADRETTARPMRLATDNGSGGSSVATVALHVSGLTCRRCVRSLSAGLRDLPGVQTVQADSATGTLIVEGEVSEQQVLAVLCGFELVVTGRAS